MLAASLWREIFCRIFFAKLGGCQLCVHSATRFIRAISLLSIHRLTFKTLGKSMGVKHSVLRDGQPPTVAFTVLAQLCGPKANETEMDAALFGKNGEEGF